MDMRMLNYLEKRMSEENSRYESNERKDVTNRKRNQIGFNDDDERIHNEMRNHKEEYFEDDDFDEGKQTKMYSRTGGSQHKNQGQQMEELLELMEKSFRKELCDVMRYCRMAEIAEESNLKDIHEGLKELCHDEFTHAKFFKAAIRYFGEDVEKSNPEVEKLWHKVKRKMDD